MAEISGCKGRRICRSCEEIPFDSGKGSAFGYGGYVRLAYCTSYETVVNSMQAFAKLAAEYGLKAAE